MELKFGMPRVTEYIKYREECGMSMLEIKKEAAIGEADVYALELAYQCYRKNIPLDIAIISITTDDRIDDIKPFANIIESMTDEQIEAMITGFNSQINSGTSNETLKTLSVAGEIIRSLRNK